MKKLMIALAVVAMAACSQAAQIKWQLTANGSGSSPATPAALNGAAIYLIAAADMQDNWASIDAIAEAASDQSTLAIANKQASSAQKLYKSADLAIGDTLDYYLLVVDAANSKYYATGKITSKAAVADGVNDKDPETGALIPAATASVLATAVGGDLADSSKWSPVGDVPEPTSAMLILLGVAGLALRRRA